MSILEIAAGVVIAQFARALLITAISIIRDRRVNHGWWKSDDQSTINALAVRVLGLW